jgi:mRNA-degrading endonuclease toxin of MazEF toxin-antitoxin module
MSTAAPPRSFRTTIELEGTPTRVLVEQTTAVSPGRLGESLGRLSASELRDLDTALALYSVSRRRAENDALRCGLLASARYRRWR